MFRKEVLALSPVVTEEFLKLYVAYKAETNFVDVVPQAPASASRSICGSTSCTIPEASPGLDAEAVSVGRGFGRGEIGRRQTSPAAPCELALRPKYAHLAESPPSTVSWGTGTV